MPKPSTAALAVVDVVLAGADWSGDAALDDAERGPSESAQHWRDGASGASIRLVAAGWTLARIQEDFPFIEAEDVRQALQYAAASAEVTMLPLQESA